MLASADLLELDVAIFKFLGCLYEDSDHFTKPGKCGSTAAQMPQTPH